jgi:predicted O-methyltransferase YrrM
VLEIGSYVGFSMLVWSHAVGPQGHVTGLEFEPSFAQIAEEAFAANGVQNTELVGGDALETYAPISSFLLCLWKYFHMCSVVSLTSF